MGDTKVCMHLSGCPRIEDRYTRTDKGLAKQEWFIDYDKAICLSEQTVQDQPLSALHSEEDCRR